MAAVGRVVATGAEGRLRLRGCETITAADESWVDCGLRDCNYGRGTFILLQIICRGNRRYEYRCSMTATASTGAERLMLGSWTTGPVGMVGSAGELQLQVRIYYGCCDCVSKSAGRVRLWVRLGLQRALVCEAAGLDVRTNYAFKAVGRLNTAVGRLDLRVLLLEFLSFIYGWLTLRIT